MLDHSGSHVESMFADGGWRHLDIKGLIGRQQSRWNVMRGWSQERDNGNKGKNLEWIFAIKYWGRSQIAVGYEFIYFFIFYVTKLQDRLSNSSLKDIPLWYNNTPTVRSRQRPHDSSAEIFPLHYLPQPLPIEGKHYLWRRKGSELWHGFFYNQILLQSEAISKNAIWCGVSLSVKGFQLIRHWSTWLAVRYLLQNSHLFLYWVICRLSFYYHPDK